MLALHGLASSAHWYDLVAADLRDRYRIIAPDQRGHGQTTQASSGYDWQSLASDAAGLLDHLGISQATVLGHSWGANVAINLAARFPDRVSKLVMIDGGLAGGRSRVASPWEEFRARARPRDISGTRLRGLTMPSLGQPREVGTSLSGRDIFAWTPSILPKDTWCSIGQYRCVTLGPESSKLRARPSPELDGGLTHGSG